MRKFFQCATLPVALTAVLSTLPLTANAYQAGDLIFRAGIASLQPDETAYGTLNTLNAGANNDEQLGLTLSYMLTDNVAFGVLAATPFKHDITSNGSKIGETKLLPPTFSLEYFPASSESKWQPFVGVGLNYTTFFSEESTLGNLELEDSTGASVEVGLDYKVSDKLIFNATVWKIDVDADANLNGNSIGGIELDPYNYMISLGYIF